MTAPQTHDAPDRVVLGILFMLGFCAIAPVMDTLAKATPAEVPVMQILLARFGIQVLALGPLALAMGVVQRPAMGEAFLHMARALALVAATWFFFTALRYMPLASAIAIFFVEPFVLTLMGGVFLGEAVGWRRLVACAVGFGGALLVIRPSFADLGLVALFPLGTAVCFAGYMVMTRSMSRRMHPVSMQFYTALAATLVLVPVLSLAEGTGHPALDPVWPSPFAMMTLAGVGVAATISHLFISYALKNAPATVIAPLQYLEIVTGIILGYTVFNELPDALTWAGIAIIVGSGLFVFMRERALGRQTAQVPPPPA